MDFNNMNNYQPQYTPPQKSPADGMITAAMVLGISAIVSAFMMTVYFPFILGGISIVMALLSKGHEPKMVPKAKLGIICSVIGLVLNFVIVGSSVYTIISDEATFRQFDKMYEYIYGESFSDAYEELTGNEFIY